MVRLSKEDRQRIFREYYKSYPDEAAILQAELILKDHPYGVLDMSLIRKCVDIHQAYFDSHKVPYEEIISRRRIEDFSQENLQTLVDKEGYFLKGGDVDFFLEERGKWDQVGGDIIRATYEGAVKRGAKVTILGSADPIRKERNNAKKIIDILKGIGVQLKVIDHPLRAILVTKADGTKKAAVWYSATQTSTYYQSHDPAVSVYTGYIIDNQKPQTQKFIESLEKTLKCLCDKSKDAETIIADYDRLETEQKLRAGSGSTETVPLNSPS